MDRYMHTFLHLAVSMHDSEFEANRTSIQFLNSDNTKLQTELQDMSRDYEQCRANFINVGINLENSQALVNVQTAEICDLKKTVEGLKATLNLSRAETRTFLQQNSRLKLEIYNAKSGGGESRVRTLSELSDISIVKTDNEDNDDLVYLRTDLGCDNADIPSSSQTSDTAQKRKIGTSKGGPMKKSRLS